MPKHDVWRSVDILEGLAAALGTLAAEDDCAQHALVQVTPQARPTRLRSRSEEDLSATPTRL